MATAVMNEPELTAIKNTPPAAQAHCDALQQCFVLSKNEPLSKIETHHHEHHRQTRLQQNESARQDTEEKLERLPSCATALKKKELRERLEQLKKSRAETEADVKAFDPQARRNWILRFIVHEKAILKRNAELVERVSVLIDADLKHQLGMEEARELREAQHERNNISMTVKRMAAMRCELLGLAPAAIIGERDEIEKAIKGLSPVALDGGPRQELEAMIARFKTRREELNEKLQTATWSELEKL